MNHNETKPQFTHDCDACVFLGSDDLHDFYFCRGDGSRSVEISATVIARFGSRGPEYASGIINARRSSPEDPLGKALARAREQGFVPPEATLKEYEERVVAIAVPRLKELLGERYRGWCRDTLEDSYNNRKTVEDAAESVILDTQFWEMS